MTEKKSNKVWDWIKANKWLVIILLAALAIRLIYWVVAINFGGDGIYYGKDTKSYVVPARSIIESGQFLNGDGTFNVTRTPGYPLLLSACMLLFGNFYEYAVMFFQLILNLLTIFTMYKLANLITKNERIALITASLAALNLLDVSYIWKILSDSSAQSLLVFALYFCVKYLCTVNEDDPKVRYFGIGCIFLTAAFFVRPPVMYLPICIAIGITFILILQKKWKQILPVVLSVVIICVTPLMLWTARNYKKTGYAQYSSVTAINLYLYNGAYIYALHNDMSYDEACAFLRSDENTEVAGIDNEAELFNTYAKLGMNTIKSDIPAYLKRCVIAAGLLYIYPGANNFLGVMSSDVSSYVQDVEKAVKEGGGITAAIRYVFSSPKVLFITAAIGIDVLLLISIFVMMIAGILISLFKKKYTWYVIMLLVGIILYYMAVHSHPVGIGTYPRFRTPFSMFVLFFVSVTINQIIEKIKAKKAR